MKIRQATTADLATIMHHRRTMFIEMGYADPAALDVMEASAAPFIRMKLESGEYREWLAEADGKVVAGGGVLIIGLPATTRDRTSRRAWILNVYTEPAYRKQGIAKAVMEEMIAWCREEGFASVALHASDAGRPLYVSLGFAPTNEMRLRFSPEQK